MTAMINLAQMSLPSRMRSCNCGRRPPFRIDWLLDQAKHLHARITIPDLPKRAEGPEVLVLTALGAGAGFDLTDPHENIRR